MTASFYTPKSSKEKIAIIIALFSLVTWTFPVAGKAHAETGEQKGLSFEINSEAGAALSALVSQNQTLQIDFSGIDQEVQLVRSYLEAKDSPLAQYTEILLAQPDWKTIIAVSNSESNMGKHCYVNNCSGIFGKNGLRTYENVPEWIVDMQNLINQRYAGWTLKEMDGVYVQPRSYNWYMASSKVYNDLTEIESQFPTQTANNTANHTSNQAA